MKSRAQRAFGPVSCNFKMVLYQPYSLNSARSPFKQLSWNTINCQKLKITLKKQTTLKLRVFFNNNTHEITHFNTPTPFLEDSINDKTKKPPKCLRQRFAISRKETSRLKAGQTNKIMNFKLSYRHNKGTTSSNKHKQKKYIYTHTYAYEWKYIQICMRIWVRNMRAAQTNPHPKHANKKRRHSKEGTMNTKRNHPTTKTITTCTKATHLTQTHPSKKEELAPTKRGMLQHKRGPFPCAKPPPT